MIIRLIRRSDPRFFEMFLLPNRLWVCPLASDKHLGFREKLNLNFSGSLAFHSRHASSAKVSNASGSTIVARISRTARTEAQRVLFDYLHSTRNLQFTDADHISKNSPTFLHDLLTRINNEQGISRALSRFLRYNPINEFEPFFESLGLTPSEYSPLLPRNLMYLSDDELLLENLHVLCNYGIPRGKIGKIYEEGTEIFRYGYGELDLKLRAYQELGLSRQTVIKLICCRPSLLIGGVNSEFLLVLEKLKDLGIQNNWIGRHLSEKKIYCWNKMLDTMDFLQKVGYTKKAMGRLFKEHPEFLLEGSGKQIYVLVSLLLKLGLKMDDILSLFLQYPLIIAGNFERNRSRKDFAKNLWQAVHFLSEIGMDTGDIAKIICTHTDVIGSWPLMRPRSVMRSLELGPDRLCEIIREDPQKLVSLASLSKIGSIEKVANEDQKHLVEKTKFLSRLGYLENSDEMTKALKQFRGRGDQLQERFDCLINAGLDSSVVTDMITMSPPVLNQTKDVIEQKIDYLVNCLGYPLKSVISFPTYLCYDLGRIRLRFSMYVWLKQRGAAKAMLSLSTILACSEKRFVKYFVDVHPEGPKTWDKLKKSLS